MTASDSTPPVPRNRVVRFEVQLEIDLTQPEHEAWDSVAWETARQLENALYSRKSQYAGLVRSIHVFPLFR